MMKIEDLVVGRTYWSDYLHCPVTVTDTTQDTRNRVAVIWHCPEPNDCWIDPTAHPADLSEITPEQLKRFGLEQEVGG